MDRQGSVLSIWPEIHSLNIFWYKNEFHEIFDGEWYAYDMQSGSHRIPGGTFFINDKFWKDYDSILKILDCEISFDSGQLVLEI